MTSGLTPPPNSFALQDRVGPNRHETLGSGNFIVETCGDDGDLLVETDAQQRTTLRLSLEAATAEANELPLRQGRTITWIAEALEPLRGELSDAQLKRLVLAIRSAIGIEAQVWLIDVAGLSPQDALRTMRWSAQAMLQAAMHGNPPVTRRHRS